MERYNRGRKMNANSMKGIVSHHITGIVKYDLVSEHLAIRPLKSYKWKKAQITRKFKAVLKKAPPDSKLQWLERQNWLDCPYDEPYHSIWRTCYSGWRSRHQLRRCISLLQLQINTVNTSSEGKTEASAVVCMSHWNYPT